VHLTGAREALVRLATIGPDHVIDAPEMQP
jgi:hypothetical protein